MNGRRCKTLRKLFRAEHGRPPEKARWTRWYEVVPSEWRRIKKTHLRATARPDRFSAERVVLTAHRDEVRRLKKRTARDLARRGIV